MFTPQCSSNLSGYVQACAYSPPGQYGLYGGSVAGYMSAAGAGWQAQSPGFSPPHPAASPPCGDFQSAGPLKQRLGEARRHRNEFKEFITFSFGNFLKT